MKPRHFTLLFLTAATGVLAYLAPFHAPFVASYLANLSAGLLATFLIVFLVERHIDATHEAERRSFERLALTDVRHAVSDLIHVLAFAIRAASAPGATLPTTIDDLLASEPFAALSWLDLDADASVLPARTWRERLSTSTKGVAERFDATLQKYSPFLSSQAAATIEDLRQDSYLTLLADLGRLGTLGPGQPAVSLHEGGGLRNDTVARLRALVDLVNARSGKRIGLTVNFDRADVEPRTGSARLTVLPPAIEVIRGALPNMRSGAPRL